MGKAEYNYVTYSVLAVMFGKADIGTTTLYAQYEVRVMRGKSDINPANKETAHYYKGQQLENKLLHLFVIYMNFLDESLSYNLTLSL